MIKDQTLLANTAKAIADGTFSHVPNQDYQQALISGDENAIKFAIVKVGYDNYKKYSGFAGMLLMDLPTDQVQYFVDFDSMVGNISVGTPYIFSPEATMMPQVVLEPGATIRAGRFSVKPEQELAGNTNKELETVAINFAEKLCAERGVKDATKINVIATEIMADLDLKIPPNKIYANLLKKFPELAPRKKAPTAAAAPKQEPEPETPAQGIGRQPRQSIQPTQTVEPIRPRRPG
jgi:acetylornithine deacetylase/succinyl-diaminopimelate desuccinylase-like protein